MNKKTVLSTFGLVTLLAFASPVHSAGGGPLESAGISERDTAAAQRGAKWFFNYCFSCHSAEYMRYNRIAEDLGFDLELLDENLVFADVKLGDTMTIAMSPEDATEWFGTTPPDLSLVSRSRGVDWLYTYMKTFYRDEAGRWNNLALPNASMPHVMWQLQGIQEPVWSTHDDGHGGGETAIEGFEIVQAGLQSPEEYERTVRDLVTFLDYLGEPAKLERKSVGIWVLLFLVVFAGVSYLLKAEYWRDVH